MNHSKILFTTLIVLIASFAVYYFTSQGWTGKTFLIPRLRHGKVERGFYESKKYDAFWFILVQ